MPFKFSFEEILREEFRKADTDGNKTLDLDEFTKILDKYGVESHKAKEIFQSNGNNGISEEEFINYVHHSEKLDSLIEEYTRMFKSIDKDNSGEITPEEFKQDWQQRGINLSDGSIDALIRSFDVDGDKTISLDEYLNALTLRYFRSRH
ncbi:unnamed protein product [Brachionus calyciflorus]|uniref:EF-hand domain-containing protein n=1 Tax=Brachionus calyciflorus TaxID=104777 RepID=A0A813YG89_9BILA|nr:unnamed protein product [Brachionus calyciflorus]